VGGISFYLIFLFSFIFIGLTLSSFNNALADKKLLGILCAITLAFLMGLADDAYDTKPLLKFSTQILCAIVLISTGTGIHCFKSDFLNYTLTVIWIVGIMNSINMLDNMDGITTIVCIVILSFFLTQQMLRHNDLVPETLLCLSVIGALCGFLIYNWHPSKMFMGDTGSQFLGALVGIMGIDFCWNIGTTSANSEIVYFPFKNLLLVSIVFILPLSDTATVSINRLLRGVSPMVGGKDHTTHHLFFKGVTEKRIAILFAAIGISASVIAHYVTLSTSLEYKDYIAFVLFPVLVFVGLFLNTRIKLQTKK
jgi:UDP-GlcNAc:undecaprenyl-phosphate GlcNAc-1-phosphate transferase